MVQTITVTQDLEMEECCSCHMLFALTDAFIRARRKDKQTFYCPNGHGQSYQGKTEEQKLKEQLDEERRRRQSAEQQIAYKQDCIKQETERADRERRRANGYKGHATRIAKRAKAGVCPCCNRTFKQLAAHMASQHPQFTPLELEEPGYVGCIR